MKKMKKFLAVVMTMAMVLGMSVTAFAEPDENDNEDTTETTTEPATSYGYATDEGTITVEGFQFDGSMENVPNGFTVKAYPIIRALYEGNETKTDGTSNKDGSFSGYKVLYSDVTPPIVIEDIETDEKGNKVVVDGLEQVNISEAMLNAIIKVLSDTDTEGSATNPIPMTLKKVGTEGEDENAVTTFTATATVPVGAYLIMVSGAESKVYNPMVASVYYSNKDQDGNKLENGTVNIIGTNTWVKVSDVPGVEKNIVVNGAYQNHDSANIGIDEIEYQVVINPIPQYGGDHPVLNIVDTLSGGLDYVEGSLEVKIYGKEVELPATTGGDKLDSDKYTVKVQENEEEGKKTSTTITVDFVKDNVYALNDNWAEGNKAVITYKAKLNANAASNQIGNENDVTLNYTRDSKVNEDEGTPDDLPKDKTYSYTFDLDGGVTGTDTVATVTKGLIVKVDGEVVTAPDTEEVATNQKILAGAEFTLYKENPTGFSDEDLEKIVYTNGVFNGKVKSDPDGQLPIRGLKAGTTYYLKETKAPDGYSLNTHVFKIVIDAKYYTSDEGNYKKGQLEYWTIQIDDADANTFKVNHEGSNTTVIVNPNENGEGTPVGTTWVPNTKLSALPSTGGIGTTIFTIGGCVIMILAAGLFFASRRKSSK